MKSKSLVFLLIFLALACACSAEEPKTKPGAQSAQVTSTVPTVPTASDLQQQKVALSLVIRGMEISKAAVEDRLVAAKVELSQVESQLSTLVKPTEPAVTKSQK
jgi:hypothetical protein